MGVGAAKAGALKSVSSMPVGKKEYDPLTDPNARLSQVAGALRPEFGGQIDEGTGLLKDPYQLSGANFDNLQGMEAMKERALGTGPSPWANLQLEQQKLQQQDVMDEGARTAVSATADARSQLARQGGLRSGASERLGQQGIMGRIMGQQQAARQGVQQRAGIMSEDERQRQAMLPQYAQAESDLAGTRTDIDKYNMEQALRERESQRQFDLAKFKEEMASRASEKQADATKAASCFGHGTLIPLEGGLTKTVQKLKIGDKIEGAGMVTKVIQELCQFPMYVWNGITLSGRHAVLDNGVWKRVGDLGLVPTSYGAEFVYNFVVEGHQVVINGHTVADYAEIDHTWLPDEECIKRLNNGKDISTQLN